jgi:hypothetical protein
MAETPKDTAMDPDNMHRRDTRTAAAALACDDVTGTFGRTRPLIHR